MSSQRAEKKSISAKQECWDMAQSLVDSREFKSVSEVVQKGIELLYEQQRGIDLVRDAEFDRKVMASLERIKNGGAVFYSPEQVDQRLRDAADKRLKEKQGTR